MKTCEFEGCDRPPAAYGLCNGHNQQKQDGRELAPLQEQPRRIGCDFDDCDRGHYAKGYCRGHYKQFKSGNGMRPIQERRTGCEFEGCDNRHEAHGLCAGHYRQRQNGDELRPLRERRTGCDFDGCTRKHHANGWCSTHSDQMYTKGEVSKARERNLPGNHEQAMARVAQYWPDFIPSGPFPGADHPWPGICQVCDTPVQPMLSMAKHQGFCATCAERGGIDLSKPTAMYVIADADGDWIKVGLSNTIERRLQEHAQQGLTELLFQMNKPDGYFLSDLEKAWKAWIRSLPQHMRCTKDSIPDGWSETTIRTPDAEAWISDHLISVLMRTPPAQSA